MRSAIRSIFTVIAFATVGFAIADMLIHDHSANFYTVFGAIAGGAGAILLLLAARESRR